MRAPESWNLLDPDVLAWQQEGTPQPVFLRKLTEVRLIVEPAAAELAAKHARAPELATLDGAFQEMKAALARKPADYESFDRADIVFHRAILQACHNDVLEQMSAMVYSALPRQLPRHQPAAWPPASPWVPPARAILEAIRATSHAGPAPPCAVWSRAPPRRSKACPASAASASDRPASRRGARGLRISRIICTNERREDRGQAAHMTAAAVELVLDARAELGEGPRWDARGQRAALGRHHARPRPRLHARELRLPERGCRPARRRARVRRGRRDGAGGGRTASRAWIGSRAGRRCWRRSKRTVPQNRMNDGACDAAGRFWAGTMALDERPGAGALYRLDPDGTVHTMLTDVTISNGIDWSPDGRRMYYVDSPTRRIDVFDFDAAHGRDREPPAVRGACPRRPGFPTGSPSMPTGFVWLALWGGAALRRYAPEGTLERIVPLPGEPSHELRVRRTRTSTSCTSRARGVR